MILDKNFLLRRIDFIFKFSSLFPMGKHFPFKSLNPDFSYSILLELHDYWYREKREIYIIEYIIVH